MSARPRRRAGNLAALKVELWGAIRAASAFITDPEASPELKLRAVSAIGTAAAVYARILEGTGDDPKDLAASADHDVITIDVRSNGHHAV
jgi:hypothetical protein